MAAVVSSGSLGLLDSSLFRLGAQGQTGVASHGRAGERFFVNAATGNLYVQGQDEILLGRGPDASVLRTYNSQGLLNDDNGDNWRLGLYRKVYGLTGTANAAGSTVLRVDADGSEAVYAYDAGRGKYVSTAGSGAYDTLSYNAGTQTWTWDDGESTVIETYDGASGGRLAAVADESGNALSFVYGAGGLLSEVHTADGEVTYLDYSGTNLTQLRTVAGAVTTVRARYAYDASNRLIQVKTDLSPEDASVADGKVYVTSYTYDGTSRRVATMAQSDGTSLAFQYVLVGADYRVSQITDALGRVTAFAYDTTNRATSVTDPLGLVTRFFYDAAGNLTSLQVPVSGQQIGFAYDAQGNVSSVTDAKGNVVTYGYDSHGNRILERDAAGNTVTRVYGAQDQLLAETAYRVPDPDGAGAAQPGAPLTTRYVYDSSARLRFVLDGEGRVSEYRYNGFGQRAASIQYTGNAYSLAGLAPTDPLTEAQLAGWVGGADKARSIRADTSYDFRGQAASVTTYAAVDAAGNGVAAGQAVTQFVYDQAGNLLKTIDARGPATSDPNDFTTSYVYDGMGRALSTSDALGRLTVSQYDDANRKTVVTLANGLVRTSTYSAAGELVSVLESSGAQTFGETKYFYDADGRLRRTEDPTGIRGHILYDEAGRKIGEIDGDGSLVEYRYDANNNVTRTIRYATAVSASALSSLANAQGVPQNVALASIRPAASGADRSAWAVYDSSNRLVASVDGAGFVTQHFYDGAGRGTDVLRFANAISVAGLGDAPAAAAIAPASSAADRLTRNFYDSASKLLATLDGEGYLLEYKYDAAGELVETIGYATATSAALRVSGTLDQLRPAADSADVHGHTLYNARGQVAGTVDGEGYLTETVYDEAGNKTLVIRYATRVAYGAGAAIADLRPAASAQDQTSSYSYDAASQLVADTKPDGTVTTYVYDSVGKLVTTTAAAGTTDARSLNARYDKQGRLTGELSGIGSALLSGSLTQAQVDQFWTDYGFTHTYDAAGRRASTTDALGNKTLFYYDADGRLVYTVNALGEVEQSVYNALGQLAQSVRYARRLSGATLASLSGGLLNPALGSAVSAIADPVRDSLAAYIYDSAGNLQQTIDSLGFTESRSFNAFGEVIGSSRQVGAGQSLEHVYAYDQRGLLTHTIWDPAGINTSALTQYDAFGRAVQTTDASGNVRTATYDKLGRVVTTRDPLNAVRATTYDAFSRTTVQTDAFGNTTSFAYDTANRTVTITTPEGVVTTTVRNRHGEKVAIADGRGNITSYQYDKNGNLTGVTAPAGATSSSYDRADRLTETVDARGIRTTYSYDAAGRVLTRVVDPGGLALTTSYAYDAKGQAVSVFDANGVETRTSYDQNGQAVSVLVDPNGLRLETTYAYDGRGKKLRVTEGANTPQPRVTEYAYDKLGRLLAQHVDPAGLNVTTAYSYDKNDNAVSKTSANGNVTRYVYDAADRPVYVIDPLGGVTRTDYDAEGRAVRVTSYATAIDPAVLPANPSLADIVVTADPARDRVAASAYDGDGRERFSIGALGAVTEKVYDASGNVIWRIAYATPLPAGTAPDAATIALAMAGTSAVGNQVTRVFYDAADRPLFTVSAAGAVVLAQYDGNGNLVSSRAYANTVGVTGVTQAQLGELAFNAADRVTRYAYDAANRQVYAIDAESYVKETRYDNAGRITQTVQHPDRVTVSAAPTAAEVAAALAGTLVANASNQTSTLYASPTQPYNYLSSAYADSKATQTQNVSAANQNALVTRDPTQAYIYAATANNDVATPATQAVAVTGQSATVSNTQPYTYIASAKTDTATAATQNIALSVQNTSIPQSANVANYSWARSASSIVQTSGLSIVPGYAGQIDNTPTGVRAKVYQNGTLLSTISTDVGYNTTESWSVPYQYTYISTYWYSWYGAYYGAPTWGNENGQPVYATGTAYRTATGTRWNNVDNWSGQVNISTGTLTPGQYTITLEAWDSAQAGQAESAFYDYTDGTWGTVSNSITVNVGTVVQPTYVRWATTTQPAGTSTVAFKYRAAGSTGAYTDATVGVSGANHEVILGSLIAGNYEYVIEYRDSYTRMLKSATGTLTSTAGQTTSTTAAFGYTQLASSAAAGTSIRYFSAAAQWAPIDHITATVKNLAGTVVSTAITYPEAESGYNGEVNLKTGAALAEGAYIVEMTFFNKNGTTAAATPFAYDAGPATRLKQTISWAASTQPSGTTPSFKYRSQGSTGSWSAAPVTAAGANQQVLLDFIPAGTYEYVVEYRDSYNRLLKNASSTFTVASSGGTTANVDFAYTAYMSTAGAGSSITGYVSLAQVPTIERVEAVVKDFTTGATVSSAITYPEFEPSYAGNVNLKVGAPLAEGGRYNVTVTIFKKDGTSATGTFYYEVGAQPVWYATQPYAYVAGAKLDTASTATVTLNVSNATEFQGSSIASYAYTRSGSSLVQGAGLSAKPGNVGYGDTTPTQVRATIYQGATQVAQTYTDVGHSTTENWSIPYEYTYISTYWYAWYGAYYSEPTWGNENGQPVYATATAYRPASGTRWDGVENWGGQVNLTTGSLAAGHYRIVLETWDSAQAGRAEGGFYDYKDGTWAYSSTLNDVVIGTIVQPTVVSWAGATQPSGTASVSFGYKAAGSSAAYTSATITSAGANQQVSLAGLANGSYDYQIEYRNAAGLLLKYSRGTFTSTQGASSTVVGGFTTLASSAAAGTSIRYFTAAAQWAPVERVSATVKDQFGNVVSTAITYPDAEADYNGEVNLKSGALLADGRYTVELTALNKNGTSTAFAPFLYELGERNHLQHTLTWAASTQPAGTTAVFKYRAQGSTGNWATPSIGTSGANQQVSFDWIAAGTYDYTIQYLDSYSRLIKGTSGSFTVNSSNTNATMTIPFTYDGYSSTASAGSSITGYIALSEVPTIERVEALVKDFLTGATVSSAITYPEFEASYAGNVNLKVGSPLADGGRYNVTITVYKKDGTSTSNTIYYEVGAQDSVRRATTVTWSAANQPAGTTAEFAYVRAGQSGESVLTPTLANGIYTVTLNYFADDGTRTGLADGIYDLTVRYKNGALLVLEGEGQFAAQAGGVTSSLLSFSPVRRQVNTFVYDRAGRLIQSTDPLGSSETYGYDALGNKTAFVDKKGSVASYAYDAAGRRIFSSDALGYVTQRAYDGEGNVTKEVSYANAAQGGPASVVPDPAKDRVTRSVYDSANQMRYTVDGEGYVTERRLDTLGQETSRIRYASPLLVGEGATVASMAALLPGAVPSSAARQEARYDVADRLFESVDGEGFVTRNLYDSFGRKTDVIRAYGTIAAATTHYGYDAVGRVLEEIQAYGTADAATTRYSLNSFGERIGTIDPRGVELAESDSAGALATRKALGYVDGAGDAKLAAALTDVEKDALRARYRSTQQFDALGRRTRAIDALGGITDTTYDASGNPVKVVDPRGNAGYFYFNLRNQAVLYVDPEGYATQTVYDAIGNAEKTVQYANNVTGGVSAGTAPAIAADAARDRVTTTQYDRRGLKLRITDAEGAYEQYSYDAFGNKLTYRNKVGGVYAYTHDRVGNLVSETLPVGSIVNRYAYDARSNRLSQTEAYGLPEQRITQFEYDKLDRQTRKIGQAVHVFNAANPAGPSTASPIEQTRYDARGNAIETVAASGDRTLAYYDARDRKIAQVVQIDAAFGALTVWQYDDGKAPTVELRYGEAVALPAPAGGTPPVPSDPANVREKRFTYNANDALVESLVVGVRVGEQVQGAYVSEVKNVGTKSFYDPAGNEVQVTDGRGNSTFRYYDRLGQKILEVDADKYVVRWERDGAGNVIRQTKYANPLSLTPSVTSDVAALIANVSGGTGHRVTEQDFDRLGRVIERRVLGVETGSVAASGALTASTANARTLFQYNGLGQIIHQVDAAGAASDIAYDAAGRKTREQGAQFSDFEGSSVRPTTDFEYDGLNQVRRELARGKNDAVETDDRITTFLYDYGFGARLIAQTDAAGARTDYFYDLAGKVASRTMSRRNADGASVLDRCDYTYDVLGREVLHKDFGTSQTNETRYNVYGEVSGKRTNGGGAGAPWQEVAEYDQLGRVWKSNSGDGVFKVYVYDANGNATLKIQAADPEGPGTEPDLSGLTLDDVMALDGDKRYFTISQYDARNHHIGTYQPSMDASHEQAAIIQFINPGAVTVSQTGQTYNKPTSAPAMTGSVSIMKSVTASGNLTLRNVWGGNGTGMADGPGYTYSSMYFEVPDTTGTLGSGGYRIAFTLGSLWTSYAYKPGMDVSYQTGNGTSLQVDFVEGGGWPNAPWYMLYMRPYSYTLYKQTPYGEIKTGSFNGVGAPPRDENGNTPPLDEYGAPIYKWGSVPYGWPLLEVSNAASFTFGANEVEFRGQSPSANRLILQYRSTGSNDGWSTMSVAPKFAGAGWFSFNWSGWTQGSYDIRYTTLDESGKVLNSQSGTMVLDSSGPSITQSSERIGGPGRAFMAADGKLHILEQGASAQTLTVHYRQAGSTGAWLSSAVLNPASMGGTGTPGWFIFDTAGLSGAYEYFVEAKSTTGTQVNKARGTFSAGNPSSVSALTSELTWVIAGVSSVVSSVHRTQKYNAFGEIAQEVDGLGHVTDFQYNSLGLLLQKISPETDITLANGFVQRGRPTTSYTYDLAGRLIGVRDPNGNLNTQALLAGDRAKVLTEFHVDGGRKLTAYDVFGDSRILTDEANAVTSQEFDKLGRLTRVVHAARPAGTPGNETGAPVSSEERYAYDQAGNRISRTNAQNKTEKTYYDSLGRVVQTTSFGLAATTYVYEYLSSIAGAGGVQVGGWLKTTTDATGRTLRDKQDVFGHVTWHKDLGDHEFTYAYNRAGWLTGQTGTSGQNIDYDYYANGYLKSIDDHSTGAFTKYEYDDEGNRTIEGYTRDAGTGREFYEYSEVTYDELNRVKRVLDPKADIRYEYDANNNRRRVWSYYHDGVNGAAHTQEYWYLYDALNRFTVTMGRLSSANGLRGTSATDTSVSVVKGNTGIDISYNAASQRTMALYGSDGHREDYYYTKDGYLEDTWISPDAIQSHGVLRARRYNDSLGRVVKYQEYDSSGTAFSGRASQYNDDSALLTQTEFQGAVGSVGAAIALLGADGATARTTFDYETPAGAGALQHSRTINQDSQHGGPLVVDTYYNYQYWDSAKELNITSVAGVPTNPDWTGWKPGYSHFQYDVNGHLKQVDDPMGGRALRYITDAQGQVLIRDEYVGGGPNSTGSVVGGAVVMHHAFYYLAGHRIGDVGNDGPLQISYAEELARNIENAPVYVVEEATYETPRFAAAVKERPSRKDLYQNWRPISSADFDQSYVPISSSYPGAASSTYTARAGDTLRAIAAAVWGDGGLWYLIADANGLSGSAALAAGQILTIPNKVTNLHNNSQTYRVYNPGEAIGDTSPTLPDAPPLPPPGEDVCGDNLWAVASIVIIIITIVMIAMSGGAGAPAGEGILSAELAAAPASEGMTVMTASGPLTTTTGATVTSGFTASGTAVGAGGTAAAASSGVATEVSIQEAVAHAAYQNLGQQAFNMLTGQQHEFDPEGLVIAMASAGITQGISNAYAFSAPVSAMTQSVVSQGINMAMGRQNRFDWRGLAASVVASSINSQISSSPSAGFAERFGTSMGQNVVGRVVNSAFTGRNLSVSSFAADMFDSALGSYAVGQMQPADRKEQQPPELRNAQADVSGNDAFNQMLPQLEESYQRGAEAGARAQQEGWQVAHRQRDLGDGRTEVTLEADDSALPTIPGLRATDEWSMYENGRNGDWLKAIYVPDGTNLPTGDSSGGAQNPNTITGPSGATSYPIAPKPAIEARELPLYNTSGAEMRPTPSARFAGGAGFQADLANRRSQYPNNLLGGGPITGASTESPVDAANVRDQTFVGAEHAAGDGALALESARLFATGAAKMPGLSILNNAGSLHIWKAYGVATAEGLEDAVSVFKSPYGKTALTLAAAAGKYGAILKPLPIFGAVATGVEEGLYVASVPADKQPMAYAAAGVNVAGTASAAWAGVQLGALGGMWLGPFGALGGAVVGGVAGAVGYDRYVKPWIRESYTGIPQEPHK